MGERSLEKAHFSNTNASFIGCLHGLVVFPPTYKVSSLTEGPGVQESYPGEFSNLYYLWGTLIFPQLYYVAIVSAL